MRRFVLGVGADEYSKSQWFEKCCEFLSSNTFHYAVTVNSLLVLDVIKNPQLKTICDEGDLLIPDSSGFTWAYSYLNNFKIERYPGVDLAFDLCSFCANNQIPVYLLGGKPGVDVSAAAFLKEKFPAINIVGQHHGYFSDSESSEILKIIVASGARFILVALGMPKQELWIHQHKNTLSRGLALGVGGTFDVWAGEVRRAPDVFQKWGLEWLYRLYSEPFRWKRIGQLPLFVVKVLKKKCA